MRNLWLTVGFVVTAGAMAYAGFFMLGRDHDLARMSRDPNPVAWLRAEFRLSEEQFAAIQSVHDAYMKQCAVHCERILEARRLGLPAADLRRIEDECVASMTAHFRGVAAMMPAREGERYLSLVLPRVADYDHSRAPGLGAQ